MTDTPAPPRSGSDLLAAIQPKLREGTATILLRPDLFDEYEALEAQLIESRGIDRGNKRLGANGQSARTRELAEQMQALEERMEESQVRFLFRAMPKDQWYAISDANPPRENNVLDFTTGYNREAVNNETVRKCLVDPVFEDCTVKGCAHRDCGSWQQFLSVCNTSEWNELVRVCSEVNGVITEAPKSELAANVLSSPARGTRRQRASE